MAFRAASNAASGFPAKVKTERFVSDPASTDRSLTPSIPVTEAEMASRTFVFLPSLKFGTHSTIFSKVLSWGGIGNVKFLKHYYITINPAIEPCLNGNFCIMPFGF
jgi:hypothetical protein